MLAAMLTIVLALGMAMMVNVSKLVTEKIALQNATDMAVYSGAATEAGYLNKMRAENDKQWKIIQGARTDLTMNGTCIQGCSGYQLQNRTLTFNGTVVTGQFGPDVFYDAQDSGPQCDAVAASNTQGLRAAQADLYVKAVAQELTQGQAAQNLKSLNQQGWQAGSSAAKQAAGINYPGTDQKFQRYDPQTNQMVQLQQVNINLSYRGYCIDIFGTPVPAVWATQDSVSGWFYKDPSNPGDVALVGAIRDAHPQDPYIDVGSGATTYFSRGSDQAGSCGGSSGIWGQVSTYLPSLGRCGITTFAAAVPYYGKLGSIEGGNATWEQQGDTFYWNEPNPSKTLDDYTTRLQKHKPLPAGGAVPYQDYKTRFIGVFDSNLNYNSGNGAKPPQGTNDLSFTQQRPIWH